MRKSLYQLCEHLRGDTIQNLVTQYSRADLISLYTYLYGAYPCDIKSSGAIARDIQRYINVHLSDTHSDQSGDSYV